MKKFYITALGASLLGLAVALCGGAMIDLESGFDVVASLLIGTGTLLSLVMGIFGLSYWITEVLSEGDKP